LPNIAPTWTKVAVDVVVIVQFRGDKVACERIYWDHANVLRQVGLLNAMAQGQHDDKEKKE
jgi:carboxymethylenebutenolidase